MFWRPGTHEMGADRTFRGRTVCPSPEPFSIFLPPSLAASTPPPFLEWRGESMSIYALGSSSWRQRHVQFPSRDKIRYLGFVG